MEFENKWIIYSTVAGSRLYGTNTKDSDYDYRGVCIPPITVRDNPFTNFEQKELPGDAVVYNLKKFMQLASDCNPNIIELFFPTEESVIYMSEQGRELLSNSNLFVSKTARFTFTGYALSQLKRIKLHRSWLLSPPKKKPEREDYNLPVTPLWGMEKITNVLYAPKETIKDIYLDYAEKERAYRSAKEQWDNYYSWKISRNPDRAILEEKFGYDTKHAMHLVRLLLEGKELLSTGKITFPLAEREFLMEIRNGGKSYDYIIEIAENFQSTLDSIESSLPEKPNRAKIEKLYFELVKDEVNYG